LDLTTRNGDSLGLIPFGYLEHGRPWAIYFSIKHRGSTMKNLEWGDIYIWILDTFYGNSTVCELEHGPSRDVLLFNL
jgi:hypothetical protein